jgi:GTP cyclohydrolase II
VPVATIRTQVRLPLRFPDGVTADARVFTFDGLADRGEHLALGLGDRAGDATSATGVPLRRSGCSATTPTRPGSSRDAALR